MSTRLVYVRGYQRLRIRLVTLRRSRSIKRIIRYSRIFVRAALRPALLLLRRGSRGELLAAGWLTLHGFYLWERNWRCAVGEIDIIAARGRQLYAIEVKSRSARSAAIRAPADAVNKEKRERLYRLMRIYRQRRLNRFYQGRVSSFELITVEVIESWRYVPRVEVNLLR